jgi:hypothetical protein
LVRPREGSQSAGLIIWFEKSGGRGFDKGPLSRAPPPALHHQTPKGNKFHEFLSAEHEQLRFAEGEQNGMAVDPLDRGRE